MKQFSAINYVLFVATVVRFKTLVFSCGRKWLWLLSGEWKVFSMSQVHGLWDKAESSDDEEIEEAQEGKEEDKRLIFAASRNLR